MQRRSFLKNAACIGACATVLSPAEQVLAASRPRPYGLTLLKLDEARGCVDAATCAPYIGYPRTNGSLRAAQEVFDQWGKREDWKPV